MGSQNVPGMWVLHCNDSIYSNAHLISFKVGTFCARARGARTHTHTHTLAPSILPLLGAPAEGFFWNLPEFAVKFDLMSSMVAKRVPLRLIFGVGYSQQPLGARSGEYGGWVMTQQAMCGSMRYRDAKTIVPAYHLPRRFFCKTCTLKWRVRLSRRYKLTVHKTVDVKGFWDLFYWTSHISGKEK
jgi:hypothetical protein